MLWRRDDSQRTEDTEKASPEYPGNEDWYVKSE
jgi:hypothetical protein